MTCAYHLRCAALYHYVIVLLLGGSRASHGAEPSAIGPPHQYSRWLGPGGELKFCITNDNYAIGFDKDLEKHFSNPTEFMDDYLMLHSCPDADIALVDEVNGYGCTHCKAAHIYSCYGQNQTNITLPENSQLSMFRMNFVDVESINSDTFSGITVNNIKIQFGGIKRIEPKAFRNVAQLKTLTINQNQIQDLGKPSEIFGGLSDLTILNLDQNQIRTWDSEDMVDSLEPLLPCLDYLSLAGNPFDILNGSSFSWLRHSPLKYLNLRESRICVPSMMHGINLLSPVMSTLEFLDLGSATMGTNDLSYLLNSLVHNKTGSILRGIGLSNLGLNQMPVDLHVVRHKLQYLSLHGNSFHSLKRGEETPRARWDPTIDALRFEDRAAFLPHLPELLELDLRDCQIKSIRVGAFEVVPKLQVLMLGHNELSYFEDGSFRNLNQVRYLDLSNNMHYPFSPPLFGYIFQPESLHLSDLQALRVLDFSHSKIDLLRRDTFAGLGDTLVNLSLSHVEMSFMDFNVFENLTALEILDLSRNAHIANMFTARLFRGLTNLLHLHLADCNLDFKQPINEMERNYSSNYSNDPFRNFQQLITLNLSDNNIKFLTEITFRSLKSVEVIDVSQNFILPWSQPVLKHNEKLKMLRLNRNRISFMTEAMLIEFSSLSVLDVSENPFMCDCYIIPFVNMASNNVSLNNHTDDTETNTFMMQNFVPFLKFRNNTWNRQLLTANEQGNQWQVLIQTALSKNIQKVLENNKYFYEGESWRFLDLTEEEQGNIKRSLLELNISSLVNGSVYIVGLNDGSAYSCMDTEWSNNYDFHAVNESYCLAKSASNVLPTHYDLSVTIAITMIIAFLIGACLFTLYRKWWYIRYYALQLKNATIMSFMGRCNDDDPQPLFQYDVFLSFCDVNRSWVLDNLIPNLENENDLRVCLHERDFQVGVSILENIIASMDRSRCILLVVSLSFIKSRWCQFELHVAQHRLLETRREELVLILLEDIPRSKRPKMLHFLMLTKTYIVWPKNDNNLDERRLFWKRLKKAVVPNKQHTISIV